MPRIYLSVVVRREFKCVSAHFAGSISFGSIVSRSAPWRVMFGMPTAGAMLSDAIANCENKIAPLRRAQLVHLRTLIATGATVEAALVLVELELPQWRLRRIVYDNSDWHCALSRQRELPDWLDEAVEGNHKDLAVAILCAFHEARKRDAANASIPRSLAPKTRARADFHQPVLCENYC